MILERLLKTLTWKRFCLFPDITTSLRFTRLTNSHEDLVLPQRLALQWSTWWHSGSYKIQLESILSSFSYPSYMDCFMQQIYLTLAKRAIVFNSKANLYHLTSPICCLESKSHSIRKSHIKSYPHCSVYLLRKCSHLISQTILICLFLNEVLSQ